MRSYSESDKVQIRTMAATIFAGMASTPTDSISWLPAVESAVNLFHGVEDHLNSKVPAINIVFDYDSLVFQGIVDDAENNIDVGTWKAMSGGRLVLRIRANELEHGDR